MLVILVLTIGIYLSKEWTLKSKRSAILYSTISIRLAITFISCVALTLLLFTLSTRVSTQPHFAEIKIGVSQTPLTAPFIIAKHLAMFEQANLNVQLVECFGGVACSEALIADQVDYATASESVVMFKSYQTQDIALLTSFVQSTNDLKLLTLNKDLQLNKNQDTKEAITGTNISNSVENPAQTNINKVGIVKGSASEYYFDTLLVAQGGDVSHIDKVYLSPKQLVNALIANQVDAISIWEPYGYQLNMSASSSITNLGIQGIYQLSFNLIAKRSKFSLDNNVKNKQVTALINVLEQSINWINNHPDAAMLIVAKHLDVPLNQIKWSWNDYIFRLSIGNSLLSSLQTQSHWAKQGGLVEGQEPNFRDVIYRQPFEQAKASKEAKW